MEWLGFSCAAIPTDILMYIKFAGTFSGNNLRQIVAAPRGPDDAERFFNFNLK